MKKKLCYVMPRYNEKIGGHYYYNYRFIESLGEKLNIFLVVESSSGEPKLKNVKGTYTRKFSRKYLPFNLIEMLLVFLFLRAKGYFTFYIHQSFASAALSSIVVKVFGGTTYLWHCGIVQRISIRPSVAFRMVTYLVTGTKSMRKYYIETFGIDERKVKIMPNWVDLERFDPNKYDGRTLRERMGISEDRKIILYIHSLSQEKGAQHIPTIAEGVWRENPMALFLIIGEGPLRKDLEAWREKESLEGKVRILGKVPNSEIPRYFKISDVFVMPSHQEGFPRVLVESMAMRVPFVGYEIGGVKDILPPEYRERLVDLRIMEEFSDRVIELLGDRELREELSEAGKERVKRYSKKAILDRFCGTLGLDNLETKTN